MLYFVLLNYIGLFWLVFIVNPISYLIRLKKIILEIDYFVLLCLYFISLFIFKRLDSVFYIKNYFLYVFLIPLFYLNNNVERNFSLNNFFSILMLLSICEFCLVNVTPEVKDYLLNYTNIYSFRNYESFYLGLYQRPYGFAGQYTVSSYFLIIIYYLTLKSDAVLTRKNTVLFFLIILIFGSGLSYISLIYIYLNKFYFLSKKNFLKFFILILVAYVLIYFVYDINQHYHTPLAKLSPQYIRSVSSFKWTQLKTLFTDKSIIQILLGYTRSFGDDFGLFELIRNLGIVGALIYLIGLCYFLRSNLVFLGLVLLSLLHYSVWFTNVGNLLLAYIIVNRRMFFVANSKVVM